MKTHLKMLLVLLTIPLVSCRTLDLNILYPQGEFDEKLPRLESVIDLKILNQQASYVSETTVADPNDEEAAMILQSFKQEEPISETANDFKILFEREVKYNISETSGDYKGQIFCKVAAINTDPVHTVLFMFSLFSFGLFNLVGLPANISSSSVDLEVEIRNLNSDLIASYHAVGKASASSGLYFGYPSSSMVRASRIKAFKKAMQQIKSQIEADQRNLVLQLNE